MKRRNFQKLGALASLGLLSGCGPWARLDHRGEQIPRYDPLLLAKKLVDRAGPKDPIAWVLSSGGPRGFVHVGVYKALEKIGVKPNLVVGASAGSLIAVLVAAGLPAAQLEGIALDLGPFGVVNFNLSGPERFSADGLAELVNRVLDGRRLEELPISVVCVAIEQKSREVVRFNAGDAGLAVQASCAIEGQLAPVRIAGVDFVDPDWVQPLPVRTAIHCGARRVLAVDASAHEKKAPPGAERFAEQDRKKRELIQADAQLAQLVLHPDIGYWANITRAYRQRLIDVGYADTMAQRAVIEALHR